MDSRKQKVYLVYEFLSEQGGLERELINHASFLKKAGYEVKVLTCHFDKKILSLLPFEGIDIEEISSIKTKSESLNLILCFLGLNNLSRYNPDLFISYSFPCNYLIRNKNTKKVNYINHFPHFLYLEGKEKIEWAKSTQGVKRWISVLLSWILGSLLKKMDSSLVRKNDVKFTNSKFTKKRIDKIYSINTIVSYPPIDPKFKRVNFKNKESYIFSSSRIIPDKKYDWLIKSVSLMKNKLPLYIAGSVENSYKQELVKLSEKLNVKIKFLGRLNTEEIRKYYSGAEVFAFAAPLEDFGLVPAEALICGTPIVVWGDGAGPTEQVADGKNGYSAKPYNLKDFAEKLDLCLDSKIKNNKRRIINSAKKFTASSIEKGFMREIFKLIPSA